MGLARCQDNGRGPLIVSYSAALPLLIFEIQMEKRSQVQHIGLLWTCLEQNLNKYHKNHLFNTPSYKKEKKNLTGENRFNVEQSGGAGVRVGVDYWTTGCHPDA